jgi:Holliday junction resolvasome RuvABC DNA-binding subunit
MEAALRLAVLTPKPLTITVFSSLLNRTTYKMNKVEQDSLYFSLHLVIKEEYNYLFTFSYNVKKQLYPSFITMKM